MILETDTNILEEHAASIIRVGVCPRKNLGDTVKRNVYADADQIEKYHTQCI